MEIVTNRDTVLYDRPPDLCPVCGRSAHVSPASDKGVVFPPEAHYHGTKLHIFYRCPSVQCGSAFIAEYNNIRSGGNVRAYTLSRLIPLSPRPYNISDGIEEISPAFVRIADQSQRAQADGLDEIAGIGFRKALEFLIKDYCGQQNPSEKSNIEKKFLGQVIKEHVSDANLKLCAERAVWLGNDEAHYLRQWNGKDIEDLKKLINLTMHWISNEHLTKQYLQSMPDPKAAARNPGGQTP